MIYDDYIVYSSQFREKYGEKTVVLIQVGDFFELYGIQNDTETCGADMFAIGDICNLTVTRKNKSILENNRQNPLMAGFPLHALSKHAQVLLDNDYTVVVIRQVTPPPNVRREVTEILSPSTNITPNNPDANWLLAMFWEKYPNGTICVGIAGADVSTGHTFICEATDTVVSYDEAYRIAQSYQPREIVMLGSKDEVATSLLSNFGTIHTRWCGVPKLAYQNEVIRKAYSEQMTGTILSPIEAVGLDAIEGGRFAFVHLIAFIYEHNELIIKRLQLPAIVKNERHLILEYNSAVQLNLLASLPHERPLINILNKCCTAFGSRLFRERLLTPLADPGAIMTRYDRIETVIKNRSVHLIRKALKNINDMERAVRRMELGTLSPMEWSSLHQSIQYAKVAAEYDGADEVVAIINTLEECYTHILCIDECAKYNMNDIKGTVFRRGVYEEVDSVAEALAEAFAHLDAIAANITSLDNAGGDACLCRIDSNERDGFFLQITKKRWECAVAKGLDGAQFRTKPISAGSAVLRVQNDDIERTSDIIINTQRKLATIVLEKYKDFLEWFQKGSGHTLKKITAYIADLDVATNNAFIAEEFGYCKPSILHHADAAYLKVNEIRHPIIERLTTQIEYVKNDVTLDKSGMLLYGINASGKSSLMKAIGLNVIMAQAGMYVAASNFVYYPFKHIFTRISSMDNIYRGMSTFVVEMAELRNILQRCDEHSLVLGDELCAGTESVSAIAIVAAGIDTLVRKKCSFIFATHLHELTNIDFIKDDDNQRIGIYHMHVETDPETGKITYDRKLKPGRGNELYGLEVCDTLRMPGDFMAVAHRIRRNIQEIPSAIVADKWSRYNKTVNVDVCKVCGEAPAEETHHIIPQQSADEHGFVAQGVKVHRASNLAPLCKKCHQEEHHGNLHVIGYRQTSDGVVLQYERNARATADNEPSFASVLADLRREGKFQYNKQQRQWYLRTVAGSLRRCKIDIVIKHVAKIIKRTLTEEELELLSSL